MLLTEYICQTPKQTAHCYKYTVLVQNTLTDNNSDLTSMKVEQRRFHADAQASPASTAACTQKDNGAVSVLS